jgi:hypothetical protein
MLVADLPLDHFFVLPVNTSRQDRVLPSPSRVLSLAQEQAPALPPPLAVARGWSPLAVASKFLQLH